MHKISIQKADLLIGKVDLLIIPCSTRGIVQSPILTNIANMNAPAPENIQMGTISVLPTQVGFLAKYVAYASVTNGGHSDLETIQTIGRRIGEHCALNKNEIQTVRTLLLGVGNGNISDADSYRNFVAGYRELAPESTELAIYCLSEVQFRSLLEINGQLLQSQAYTIRMIAKSIRAISLEEFIRRDLGERLNFSTFSQYIQGIWNIANAIYASELDEIPETILDDWIMALKPAATAMNALRGFSIEDGGDIIQRRGHLLQNIRNTSIELFTACAPILGFINSSSSKFINYKNEIENISLSTSSTIKGFLEVTEKTKEDFSKQFDDLKRKTETQADEILRKARGAAEQAAFATHAKFFDDQANQHKELSAAWFRATLAIELFIAVALAIITCQEIVPKEIQTLPKEMQTTALVFHASHYGLIIGALLFALIWAVRNYRSHMHNWVVNSHRSNAIKTYPALSAAVENDKEARIAVLTKSTEAIFSHMPTGYMPAGTDDAPAAMQVVEILKPSSK